MIRDRGDWIKSDKPIKSIWAPVLGNVIAVLFPRLFCMIIKNEPNIFSQWMNICPWEELLLLWHWMSLSKLFFSSESCFSLFCYNNLRTILLRKQYWTKMKPIFTPFHFRLCRQLLTFFSNLYFFHFHECSKSDSQNKTPKQVILIASMIQTLIQETSWESVKVLIVKASHLFKYAVSHSSLNYQCISTDSFHLRLCLLRTLSVSKKKMTHHFKMLFLLFASAHRPFYAVCTCCLATCTKCHIWILYGDVHCMLMLWAKHTSP